MPLMRVREARRARRRARACRRRGPTGRRSRSIGRCPPSRRAVASCAAAMHAATTAATSNARIAAPSTAPLESPNGLRFTSSDTTSTGVLPFTSVSGIAVNTVLPARPCWRGAGLAASRVEVAHVDAVGQRHDVAAGVGTEQEPERLLHVTVGVDREHRAARRLRKLVRTSARIRPSWR